MSNVPHINQPETSSPPHKKALVMPEVEAYPFQRQPVPVFMHQQNVTPSIDSIAPAAQYSNVQETQAQNYAIDRLHESSDYQQPQGQNTLGIEPVQVFSPSFESGHNGRRSLVGDLSYEPDRFLRYNAWNNTAGIDYLQDQSSDSYQSVKKSDQSEEDRVEYDLGHSFQPSHDSRIATGGMVVAGEEYNEQRPDEQQQPHDSLFNQNQVIFEYYQDHQIQMYNYQQQYLQPGNMNLNDMIQQNDMAQHEPAMVHQPVQQSMHVRSLPEPSMHLARPSAVGKAHTKSHKDRLDTSSRKYVCTMCNKRFTRPSTLTTHMNSHTGERPFACDGPGCSWRFTVLSNLKRHSKICPHIHAASLQNQNQQFHHHEQQQVEQQPKNQLSLFTNVL